MPRDTSISLAELDEALPTRRPQRRFRKARPKPYDRPDLALVSKGKSFGQEIVALKIRRAVDKADAYDLERSIMCCIDEMANPEQFYTSNYNPKNPRHFISEHFCEFEDPSWNADGNYKKVAGLVRSKLRTIFNELRVRHPVIVIDPQWRFLDFIANKNEKFTWCGTKFGDVIFLRFGRDAKGIHFAPASYRPKVDFTLRYLAESSEKLRESLSVDDGRPRCDAPLPWGDTYVPKPLGIPAPKGMMPAEDGYDRYRMNVIICDLDGTPSPEEEARAGAEGLSAALYNAFKHKENPDAFYEFHGDALRWEAGCKKRETKQSLTRDLIGIIGETLDDVCDKFARAWPLLVVNTCGTVISAFSLFGDVTFIPKDPRAVPDCICIAYEDGCFFTAVPPPEKDREPFDFSYWWYEEEATASPKGHFVSGGVYDPNTKTTTKDATSTEDADNDHYIPELGI
jgi:hypothetical protein